VSDPAPSPQALHGDASAYALVYEEAVRALDDQRAVLDNMRTWSGIVLSAAAVTTSFFGGLALRDGTPGPLGWTAVAAFVLCGVAGLAIVFPHGRWEFRASPASLIADIELGAPPIGRIQRDLSLYMEKSWLHNEKRMQWTMVWPLRVATLALVAEVLAWVLDLSGIG
jgi:hypothetical protein